METIENFCVKIQKPKSKPFVVVTWYRPPDSHIEVFTPFEEFLGKLDTFATLQTFSKVTVNFKKWFL